MSSSSVVYHLVPTSNHNRPALQRHRAPVVYHLVPTSNHNQRPPRKLVNFVVYHLVPTSNHNTNLLPLFLMTLFIILFLHQTTTMCFFCTAEIGCLSSCSYIKPQHVVNSSLHYSVVYHLVPTSNHNYEARYLSRQSVVYHLVPTSNHNLAETCTIVIMLFIILFLHQTTT